MKKKDDAAKQIMLYVILLGIVAFALVYILGYRKYNEKADKLKNENADLQLKVAELKVYYDKEPEYKQGIENMEEAIDSMMEPFPAQVKSENVLMVAYECLMKADELQFKSISTVEEEVIHKIPTEVVLGANIEKYQYPLGFINDGTAYQLNTDYKGLKDCVNIINALDDRCTIKQITFTKQKEDNILEGTIEVNYYSVIGAGKKYVPVSIPDYKEGLEDIFNLKTDEELEEEAKNEEKKD